MIYQNLDLTFFFVYHNFSSINNKAYQKEFDFEKLYESSKNSFFDEANFAYLEMAFFEIKNNRFKIEVWEKEIFNSKKLIDKRKSNPKIKDALMKFKNNITINGVINLLNATGNTDQIDLDYLMKEVGLITKSNSEIYKSFLNLLDQKKLKPSSKLKHKKHKKSKLPYFPILSEIDDFTLSKLPKIYSKIYKPNDYNSESEEDILHRK